jgi:hypothetical protein
MSSASYYLVIDLRADSGRIMTLGYSLLDACREPRL